MGFTRRRLSLGGRGFFFIQFLNLHDLIIKNGSECVKNDEQNQVLRCYCLQRARLSPQDVGVGHECS